MGKIFDFCEEGVVREGLYERFCMKEIRDSRN